MAENSSSRRIQRKSLFNRSQIYWVTIGLLILTISYGITGCGVLELLLEAPAPTEIVETGSGNEFWTVYFTDPARINDPDNIAGSIPEQLIGLIDSAQESIHIASFEFNLRPVAEALIAAHERGVEVQWVTDDEHGIDADEEDGNGLFEMMADAGIEIVDDGRGALMHNKFWIFDGYLVWTGSTNITENGNFRNNNNAILIASRRIAEIYEREFIEMFVDGQFGPRSPSTVELQSTTVNDTPLVVYFAPEDEVISKLVPIVQTAEQSIRVMAFSFTHDDLGAAVLGQARDGVDVRAIFEKRGSETEYSELPRLYCAGIPVRQDGNNGSFHHKVLIIDDEILVTGSLNFSNNANESNDENVIIIQNPELAAAYTREFDRRWAEAEMPDQADMNCR